MLRLDGAIKNYDWGSTDAIPRRLGREPDGRPWAEYWLGAHPDGPARADGRPLNEVLAECPELLGELVRHRFGDKLPYLVKLLSAARALSIQVHPSRAQAEAGYAREVAGGQPDSAPTRSFHDTWPKPEILIALGPFDALVDLRSPRATAGLLRGLDVPGAAPIVAILEAAGDTPEDVRQAFDLVLDAGTSELAAAAAERAAAFTSEDPALADFAGTVGLICAAHPGDPSLFGALMLNHLRLERWQSLYVPAGTLHAYLHGDGVEVMGASDNVVRAGLTTKQVDRETLAELARFTVETPSPRSPEPIGAGLAVYVTPAPEFRTWLLRDPDADASLPGTRGARILLALEGEVVISGEAEHTLTPGQACFLPAGEVATVRGGTSVLVGDGLDQEA